LENQVWMDVFHAITIKKKKKESVFGMSLSLIPMSCFKI